MNDYASSSESHSNSFNASAAEACKEIAFGSVAGMVAEIFEYLAKVRLQAQVLYSAGEGSVFTFNGPLHCLRQTWKEEGLRGLYRGVSAPLIGSMAQTAALFLAYSSFQNAIRTLCYGDALQTKPSLTIPQMGAAAAGAGFVTSFILMQVQMMNMRSHGPRFQPKTPHISPPITKLFFSPTRITSAPTFQPTLSKPPVHDLTTARTLLPPPNSYIHARTPTPSGSLSIIRSIFAGHGLKGFWLGQTATLFHETGGCAAWFVTKEVVADALQKRRYGAILSCDQSLLHTGLVMGILPWESAVAGAAAGGAGTLPFYPADTVKSAIQTEEELSSSRIARAVRPSTFWQTALRMYRTHGLGGFYAGCGMTVVRSVLSSGIIFVVYDGLQQRLN